MIILLNMTLCHTIGLRKDHLGEVQIRIDEIIRQILILVKLFTELISNYYEGAFFDHLLRYSYLSMIILVLT